MISLNGAIVDEVIKHTFVQKMIFKFLSGLSIIFTIDELNMLYSCQFKFNGLKCMAVIAMKTDR